MIQLYDFYLSGNAHKVRNQLSLLGIEHERKAVDLAAGEQKTDAFLALNPFGKVPVLVDDDVVVRDSSAILVYLARKYGNGGGWLPADAAGQARVQEWLAVASDEIAHGPGFARLIVLFGAEGDLAAAQQRSHALLARFEAHLSRNDYLVGDSPTIADIANYTYIAVAPDGGVELDAYPAVRAWISRLESIPSFETAPVRPH